MDRIIHESSKRITCGYMGYKNHRGVDLGWRGNEEENKVHANCKGTVYEIQDGLGTLKGATGTKSWGNYVYIKHPNGMFTRYAHLRKGTIQVKKGQEVDENTVLAVIGESGNVTARHLHFEVSTGYSSNLRIDPTPYLTKPVWEENTVPTSSGTYQTYDNVKKKWLPNVSIGSAEYAGNFGNSIGGIYLDNHKIRVHDKNKGYWLPWVENREDYSGNLGNKIDGVQIENATYRVHIKNGNWLPWVSKADDTNDGYAGIYGNIIDAIQIK